MINFERKKIKQTCISRQAFVKSVGLSAEYSPICMFVLQEWGLFCLLANTRVSGGIYGPCVNSNVSIKDSVYFYVRREILTRGINKFEKIGVI